jgi:hypothetical protein
MEDRTYSYSPCPKCGKEMETYNAPSCLMWSSRCNSCGYDDGLDYYEAPNNVIELIKKEDAIKKGLIMECPICKEIMTWWEKRDYEMCVMCNQEKTIKK